MAHDEPVFHSISTACLLYFFTFSIFSFSFHGIFDCIFIYFFNITQEYYHVSIVFSVLHSVSTDRFHLIPWRSLLQGVPHFFLSDSIVTM